MIHKTMNINSVQLSNVMARASVESAKGRVVSHAANLLIQKLNNLTKCSSTKILKSDSSNLNGSKLFNGFISLQASVIEKGLPKVVEISMTIDNSNVVMPSDFVICKKISEVIAVNTSREKSIKLASEHLQKVQEYIAKEAEISETGARERSLEREGKTVTVPSGGSSNSVPSAQVAHQLIMPKINLPESTQDGDDVEISGRVYKVSPQVNNFGQDGGNWVLTLVEK